MKRTSRGLVGHAKHSEAVGALDMEDIAIVGIGSVGVVGDEHLVQYLSGHVVGIGGRGTSTGLRQNHLPPRHHPIQNPHLRPDGDPDQRSAQLPTHRYRRCLIFAEID